MSTIQEIGKVSVAGAGLMGKQIALNAAIAGYEVWLYDSFPEAVDKADGWSKTYLASRVEKGKMTEEVARDTLSRFHLSKDLEEAVKGSGLFIEAIIEKQDAKEDLFSKVDKILAPDALIATNSSYMVSSLFAHCVSNPSRLANLHYFNPALVMKLVEIVKGPHTSDETVERLYAFVQSIGKLPVVIKKEVEGFIVNRFSNAIANTALELLDMEVASPQDIDIALENGLNHPMGPFRLMDLTGIDLAYYVSENKMQAGEKVNGYKYLKEKYDAGEYGKKTGKGWYDYSDDKAKAKK